MDMRQKLAIIAENEAKKYYHGFVMTMEPNIQPITSLFPKWSMKKWNGNWCAAFTYFCCRRAGFNLPVRYPNPKVPCNFAGCYAWEIWSKLPENKFFYKTNDESFLPDKGDIVIYDYIFERKPHDHLGIIIENRKGSILVAEGNVNNISAIVERKKNKHIRGYIRIPNEYNYRKIAI